MKWENPESLSSATTEEESENYEEKKERLLSRLPIELQERWEEASLEEIENIIQKREGLGYKKRTGFHVSPVDLPIGSDLKPSAISEGKVFYTDNIEHLYGKHAGGILYIIEGTEVDELVDKRLGWYRTRGTAKIVDKIKITPETMESLGAGFAQVEYH